MGNKSSNQYEEDTIKIEYKIKKGNENKIKVFHSDFVKKNKHKCKIIYNNIKYELKQYFEFDEDNIKENEEILSIKLKGINKITNASFMFCQCSSLILLPNLSQWDTSNITNIACMFYECNSLISLPDISKWKTSNIHDMSYIFYECNSLISLPDISKWDTSNVTNLSHMFYGCKSLVSLPDISKWDTSNVTNMEISSSTSSTLWMWSIHAV